MAHDPVSVGSRYVTCGMYQINIGFDEFIEAVGCKNFMLDYMYVCR